MAKKSIPSVNEIPKFLHKEKLLPLFFLIGEDDYTIEKTVEEIRKFVEPLVSSEFDKEFINSERNVNLTQILDTACSFPFGGGKKLIVIKNFESIANKKELNNYINSPAEFTVMIITQLSKPSDLAKEPYSLLIDKKYLFEAKAESGNDLIEWLIGISEQLSSPFDYDTAQGLIEIVGNDKGLLEMQVRKILDYSIGKPKLSFDEIKKLVSPTKQHTVFDLQDAIGAGNKSKALEIAFNLLDAGISIVMIISMLAKYLSAVSQVSEFNRSNVNDNEAARKIGVSWFYYVNCKKARFLMPDERLLKASRALFNADMAVKSSNTEHKTILIMMLSEMMGN